MESSQYTAGWIVNFSLAVRPVVMGRRPVGLLFLALAVVIAGCGPRETTEQEHREANTPAGKVGQVAHKVAVQTDKAGHVIGRELGKAAHDAHEGWKEDAQKDRSTR